MPMRGRGAPRGGMARGGSRFAVASSPFAAPPMPGVSVEQEPIIESSGSADVMQPEESKAHPEPTIKALSNDVNLDFLDQLATPTKEEVKPAALQEEIKIESNDNMDFLNEYL